MRAMSRQHKMIAGAAVIGLVIGMSTGYFVWGMRSGGSIVVDDLTKDVELNQASVIASMQESSDMLEVQNQGAGKAVMVARATLISTVSWVAVHEDINGELGSVLGARSVAMGEYSNMYVPLLRGTTAGREYHVGIYTDNGDLKFDRKTDTLLRFDNGEMIGASFVAF